MEIEINPGATTNADKDDDLFADIFDDKSYKNVPEKQIFIKKSDETASTNFEILEVSKKNDNKVFQIEIQPENENKPPSNAKADDLFADVFQDEPEVNDFEPEVNDFEPEVNNFEAQEEKNSVTEYSAEKMKQTDQLFLKIASKYMEPSTSKSNNSSAKKGEYFIRKKFCQNENPEK